MSHATCIFIKGKSLKDLWWMLQGLVVGVISPDLAFPLRPLLISLVFLFVCAVVSLCSKSLWFTPSNSRAPAAKKLLVFLRDFPHLLRVYFFILSLSPPPASTSSFLSHTLLLWPNFFFPFTHSRLLSVGFFSAPFFFILLVLQLFCVLWFSTLICVFL